MQFFVVSLATAVALATKTKSRRSTNSNLQASTAETHQSSLQRLTSPGHCFGPSCCVHVDRTKEGSCVLETKCAQAKESHASERLAHLEFSIICETPDQWQKHSFGYGGFDSEERFVTEIQCAECHAPRLSDYSYALGKIGQPSAANVNLVRKNTPAPAPSPPAPSPPAPSPPAPSPPAPSPPAPAPSPQAPAPSPQPEEKSPFATIIGSFCDDGVAYKSNCCDEIHAANKAIEEACSDKPPESITEACKGKCGQTINEELNKLTYVGNGGHYGMLTRSDALCTMTARIAQVALEGGHVLCGKTCTADLKYWGDIMMLVSGMKAPADDKAPAPAPSPQAPAPAFSAHVSKKKAGDKQHKIAAQESAEEENGAVDAQNDEGEEANSDQKSENEEKQQDDQKSEEDKQSDDDQDIEEDKKASKIKETNLAFMKYKKMNALEEEAEQEEDDEASHPNAWFRHKFRYLLQLGHKVRKKNAPEQGDLEKAIGNIQKFEYQLYSACRSPCMQSIAHTTLWALGRGSRPIG